MKHDGAEWNRMKYKSHSIWFFYLKCPILPFHPIHPKLDEHKIKNGIGMHSIIFSFIPSYFYQSRQWNIILFHSHSLPPCSINPKQLIFKCKSNVMSVTYILNSD